MTKSEYQRLRKTALKRIARLEAAGLSERLIKNYSGGAAFPSYTQLKGNAKQMTASALKLHAFLSAKTSTVRGAKAARSKIKKTLSQAGVTNITESKLELFGEFMKAARAASDGSQFDSERAVDAFETAEKKRGFEPLKIASKFDQWVAKNIDRKIEKRKTPVTSEQLNNYLGINENGTKTTKKSNGTRSRKNGVSTRNRRSSGTQKKKK